MVTKLRLTRIIRIIRINACVSEMESYRDELRNTPLKPDTKFINQYLQQAYQLSLRKLLKEIGLK